MARSQKSVKPSKTASGRSQTAKSNWGPASVKATKVNGGQIRLTVSTSKRDGGDFEQTLNEPFNNEAVVRRSIGAATPR
jgi:hypothetical protein